MCCVVFRFRRQKIHIILSYIGLFRLLKVTSGSIHDSLIKQKYKSFSNYTKYNKTLILFKIFLIPSFIQYLKKFK